MRFPRRTRKRFEHANELRFLTFSCFRRLPLFTNDAVKVAFVQQMAATQSARPFQLNAWVIMPEHVHLMIEPQLPTWPVPLVLQHMKGCFANRVLKRWAELHAPILDKLLDAPGKRRFWQPGGGYDRNLNSTAEVEEKFHYIHENPVARGVAKRAIDWAWSSARWYAGEAADDGLTITPPPTW